MQEDNIGTQIPAEEVKAPEGDQALLLDMAKAGILYGRKKSKTHPRMKQFIHATRNGIEIIDIEQTIEKLEEAGEFLARIFQKKGTVLCVGTTPSAKATLREFAENWKQPFVTERWLGGTLTNFKTLHKRLDYYLKLKKDKETGRLEKYTKKEQLDFAREIERLEFMFGGLEDMNELPKALFVINAGAHEIAILEARKLNIPVIAFMSNDTNPEKIDYVIPGNDRARSSIAWVLDRIKQVVTEKGGDPTKIVSKKEEK